MRPTKPSATVLSVRLDSKAFVHQPCGVSESQTVRWTSKRARNSLPNLGVPLSFLGPFWCAKVMASSVTVLGTSTTTLGLGQQVGHRLGPLASLVPRLAHMGAHKMEVPFPRPLRQARAPLLRLECLPPTLGVGGFPSFELRCLLSVPAKDFLSLSSDLSPPYLPPLPSLLCPASSWKASLTKVFGSLPPSPGLHIPCSWLPGSPSPGRRRPAPQGCWERQATPLLPHAHWTRA